MTTVIVAKFDDSYLSRYLLSFLRLEVFYIPADFIFSLRLVLQTDKQNVWKVET